MKKNAALSITFFLSLYLMQSFAQTDLKLKHLELGDFKLVSGKSIEKCQIAYRTFGKLNTDKSNAILIPTWFGGTSYQKSFMADPTGMADSSKFFVIVVDAFGNGVSSSPSNSIQKDASFPDVSIKDMVNAQHLLVTKALSISKLYAVMGISMGGMQTFEWLASYPHMMQKAVPIIGTPQQSSYDKIFWNMQLNVLKTQSYDKSAFKLIAALHEMNLYTPEFHSNNLKSTAYNDFIGRKENDYVKAQHPYNWALQLKAMINHDIFQTEKELSTKANVLVVVATQDHMVNPMAAIDLAKKMKWPILELEGPCGHMATSCESQKMTAFVKAFIE